jgi:hypothetical protein
MSDHATDVMIAGYITKQPALLDYEAVLKSGAKFDGVVCVSRDLEGNTSIEETDHLKKGGAKALRAAGWGTWRTTRSRARSKSKPLKRFRGVEPV